MKNSKELTQYVLMERDAYQEKLRVRNRRIKFAGAVCSLSLVLCVSAVSYKFLTEKDALPKDRSELIRETEYTTSITVNTTESASGTGTSVYTTANTSSESKNSATGTPVTTGNYKSSSSKSSEIYTTALSQSAVYTRTTAKTGKPLTGSTAGTQHTTLKTTKATVPYTVPVTETKTVLSSAVTNTLPVSQSMTVPVSTAAGTYTFLVTAVATIIKPTDLLPFYIISELYSTFTFENRKYYLKEEMAEPDIIDGKIGNIMFSDFRVAEVFKIKNTSADNTVAVRFNNNISYNLYTAD